MNDLDDLFQRDPLQLTREEKDSLYATLRAQRHQFLVAEAKPKKAKAVKGGPKEEFVFDPLAIEG